MALVTTVKTTFSAGEVTPDLLGRGDLRAYENGAAKLRNVFIQPTGGVTRRSGLRYCAQAAGAGRLIAFEFNTVQTYLLVFTDRLVTIYLDGAEVSQLPTPWESASISQLAWTQSADTLLLMHPDTPPKKLVRTGTGTWAIVNWTYYTTQNRVHQPMYKFAATDVSLTPSAVSGTISVTASHAVFQSAHNGTRLRLGNKEILITEVNSPTVVTATVSETLLNINPTIDWEEQSFSAVRGYPVTAAFHQDRLVIGGSRDLPNRIWMSQSGDLFNFDTGTGLDSEAIEFGIYSDQINAIRGIFSGRHLQVFTSGAEWMVTGDPLTPATVQIKRQTRIGSHVSRYIPPVDVDGATLFVARNGQELREFIYTDVEQAYSATDLALLSHHIITTPIDQDYDQKRRLLYLIRADGQFATLTVYRAEEVAAWTLHQTDGRALSVAVVGDDVYLLLARENTFTIERIDDTLNLDMAMTGEVMNPASHWTGLDHLNGRPVNIIGDGRMFPQQIVTNGMVHLTQSVKTLQVGLPFTHVVEPLPPANMTGIGMAKSIRLLEAVFRLQNTAALQLDTGRGFKNICLRQIGEDDILDSAQPLTTGDIRIKAYGWRNDTSQPLWRIEQSQPYPFTLLAVTTSITAN